METTKAEDDSLRDELSLLKKEQTKLERNFSELQKQLTIESNDWKVHVTSLQMVLIHNSIVG